MNEGICDFGFAICDLAPRFGRSCPGNVLSLNRRFSGVFMTLLDNKIRGPSSICLWPTSACRLKSQSKI
jgi:hypothetical protein